MKKQTIGIIGGNGKMGQWFKRFFEKNNLKVIVSDVDTGLTNKELVESADTVIFSVPIGKTAEVIESVLPYTRRDQILMDLTSIKTPAVNTMLKSDCEVLGLHPMFGPFLDSMSGQTIVLCRARARDKTELFEKLFLKEGAKLKISSPEEHDRMVAVVQVMTHFSSIAYSNALMELGVKIDESMKYASPVYKIHMEMIARIMAQDPRLYAEIEIMNPYAKEVLREFVRSCQELLEKVEKKDADSFVDYFKESADHLGNFKDKALRETNKMIGGKNG